MKDFVLKRHVCCSKSKLITQGNAYVVCVDGKSKDVFDELPLPFWRNAEVRGKGNRKQREREVPHGKNQSIRG